MNQKYFTDQSSVQTAFTEGIEGSKGRLPIQKRSAGDPTKAVEPPRHQETKDSRLVCSLCLGALVVHPVCCQKNWLRAPARHFFRAKSRKKAAIPCLNILLSCVHLSRRSSDLRSRSPAREGRDYCVPSTIRSRCSSLRQGFGRQARSGLRRSKFA